MSDAIEVGREGPVQVLRLARPDKKNALTAAMYRALADALENGDGDQTIAAHVIFGAPGIFSAGNDIADFLAASSGSGQLGPDILRFLHALAQLKKPLLAGVDGIAIGVGTTLLLHCDLVFATPRSTFSTPFLDLGLVPEAASSLLLPRLAGYQRAFEMLVLGETFDAERARDCGIVNRLVEADDLETSVMDAAKRLAAKPPEALAMARRLIKGPADDIIRRIDDEAQIFAARLKSAEAGEAFRAFLEKRRPNFTEKKS